MEKLSAGENDTDSVAVVSKLKRYFKSQAKYSEQYKCALHYRAPKATLNAFNCKVSGYHFIKSFA